MYTILCDIVFGNYAINCDTNDKIKFYNVKEFI